MKKCTYCGKKYPDEATACAVDAQPLETVVAKVESPSPESLQQESVLESTPSVSPEPPRFSQPKVAVSGPPAMTRGQGIIIIVLLLALLGFPLFQVIHPRWEYRTEELPSTSISRTGAGAAQPSTILLQVSKLDAMGEQGWELVGTFLEMETAYPNLGNEDYVTGIRENIRPQKLVLMFKRRVTIF